MRAVCLSLATARCLQVMIERCRRRHDIVNLLRPAHALLHALLPTFAQVSLSPTEAFGVRCLLVAMLRERSQSFTESDHILRCNSCVGDPIMDSSGTGAL